MNPQTLEALNKSIEHWKRLASGERLEDENIGGLHCALCQMFVINSPKICVDCPVADAGHIGCNRTPYKECERMNRDYGLDSPQFKAAAQKELEFLQSLLPKEQE